MKKPLHSTEAVARSIQILEHSIETKEGDLRAQRDEQSEFQKYILLHQMYREDPESMRKPPYRLAALEDGVKQIQNNVRRIEELLQKERSKLLEFYRIMEACKTYEEWARQNPQLASGIVEIDASKLEDVSEEEADADPDFMTVS